MISEKTRRFKERIAKKSAEKAALIAENERLKALLGLDAATNEETWGAFAPQEVRDQVAAAALIHEKLRYEHALKRLGFKIECDERGNVGEEIKRMGERIFGTPGVQEMLAKITETEVVANAESYVQRLNRIAMSDDDSEANRAIQSLAKLGGLNKEKPMAAVDARTVNLFLIGRKGATKEALAGGPAELQASEFLTHEPGEPERIFEVEEGQA